MYFATGSCIDKYIVNPNAFLWPRVVPIRRNVSLKRFFYSGEFLNPFRYEYNQLHNLAHILTFNMRFN